MTIILAENYFKFWYVETIYVSSIELEESRSADWLCVVYKTIQNWLVFYAPNGFQQIYILIFNNTVFQRRGFKCFPKKLKKSALKPGINFLPLKVFFWQSA